MHKTSFVQLYSKKQLHIFANNCSPFIRERKKILGCNFKVYVIAEIERVSKREWEEETEFVSMYIVCVENKNGKCRFHNIKRDTFQSMHCKSISWYSTATFNLKISTFEAFKNFTLFKLNFWWNLVDVYPCTYSFSFRFCVLWNEKRLTAVNYCSFYTINESFYRNVCLCWHLVSFFLVLSVRSFIRVSHWNII